MFIPAVDIFSAITSQANLEAILEGQSSNRVKPWNVILEKDVDTDTEPGDDESIDHTLEKSLFLTRTIAIECKFFYE